MAVDSFVKLLERMVRRGVVNREDQRGCSTAEIQNVESKYRVRLPPTYRHYLEPMGHSSGRLFAHDHVNVSYAAVLEMTSQQRGTDAGVSSPHGAGLPSDALIILGRLGEQFEFIRCSEAHDPPVWYFEASSGRVRNSHRSVLNWLKAWCAEAEDAIASGHFDT